MTKRETKITRREDDGMDWTGRRIIKTIPPSELVPKPAGEVLVRCVWHTRVVVSPEQTLSGMRYEFEPGEVRGVRKVDADRLLSLVKKQAANCCGPGAPPVLHYFEAA